MNASRPRPAGDQTLDLRPGAHELLERVASGDHAALAELYDRLSRTLWAIGRRRGIDPEWLVRSVMLEVWRTAPRRRVSVDPSTWLVQTIDVVLSGLIGANEE